MLRCERVLAVGLSAFVLVSSGCTLLEQRLQANENDAVQSVRTLNAALTAQKLKSGSQTYVQSVSALGNAVPRELACGEARCPYRGYSFEYQAAGAKYVIVARPNKFDNTGRRSFFTDETGVIHFTNEDRTPTAQDGPLT